MLKTIRNKINKNRLVSNNEAIAMLTMFFIGLLALFIGGLVFMAYLLMNLDKIILPLAVIVFLGIIAKRFIFDSKGIKEAK